MLLNSNLKISRRQLCQGLSCLVGFFVLNVVSPAPPANGQQTIIQQPIIQQPIIQPANPIYQSPTYQGPIYQGPGIYPNQGRIIQQQPVPGTPIYRVPAVGIQTVPPVSQRIQQPSQPAAPRQSIDAEQAAYNAEKLALVEKLLEKYKASAVENQDAIEQLESLKLENHQS